MTWVLENNGETHKVNVQPRIAINDYAGVQSAVINGLGISEIPSIVCGPSLQDGRLVEVMPDWRFSPVTLFAIYPSNRNLSRLVSRLDCVLTLGTDRDVGAGKQRRNA